MRRATLTVCALLLTTRTAFALNPALDVSQYVHTSWRVRDGFVSGILTAISQTSDGYIWLGTDQGLFRFDGVRTVPWQATSNQPFPSTNITNLLAGRDGTLWIGTEKGLATWKDAKLSQYADFAGARIGRILEARDGSLWVIASNPGVQSRMLCTITDGRARCEGAEGGAGAEPFGLYEDRGGRLWVGGRDGIWQWRPVPRRFYSLGPLLNGFQGFAEADDGALLLSMVGGVSQLRDGRAEPAYHFPQLMQDATAYSLLRDRDGGIWVGTTRGLVHFHQGITDVFAQVDGLSGDVVSRIFEDREGSIWVATAEGLDHFREAPVASFSARQGLSNSSVQSVLASSDGSIWFGTSDGFSRLRGSDVTVYRERSAGIPQALAGRGSRLVREIIGHGLPAGAVMSVFQDHRSRVWVSMLRGVGFLENDRFVPVAGLPGGVTRAIVEDSRNLWVVNQELGLYRVSDDGAIGQPITWEALKQTTLPSAAAADPSQAGVWIGFAGGVVINVVDDRIRAAFGPSNGLTGGLIRGLRLDDSGALWVAADGGLSRLKDGRVATLTSQTGLPCDAVQFSVEDARSFWIGMSCGLVQIGRSEIDAWAVAVDQKREAGLAVRTRTFGNTDGVRMSATRGSLTAPAVMAADGTLWFVSLDGVSMLNPGRLPYNTIPPPVHIEQITANRKAYDLMSTASESLRLPPLVRDLQIDYTALSLVAAETVQFRYKLEGLDADWHDAGTRRQAFYNDLPPRTYRFRVIASNNSGVWNSTGATLDFVVAPAYYQTYWFLALSAAAVIATGWGAHRIRLRIVERHEREISALNERLMKAQEQERIRIAGELHDGVMQKLLAVTMMVGSAKRRIPAELDAKAALDRVQDKLVDVGTDIRQLSHDLHPPMLQETGLPNAVRGYCDEFSAAHGIPVSCDADENVGELSRGTALALYRILQEALGNAAKHARATHITVRLARSNQQVLLVVSDDGRGFNAGRPGASGGLGLLSMRERASQLNGTFAVESAAGRGTTIRVVIPFR